MTTPADRAQLRQALEEALVANPDDAATHAAYADLLLESGEPKDAARGEFIGVQLALEDEGRSVVERERLKWREGKLLQAHQEEWLGELAPFLLDNVGLPAWAQKAEVRFRRGQLAWLRLPWLSAPLAHALARAPQASFLERLEIEEAADENEDLEVVEADPLWESARSLASLLDAPFLTNLRTFRLGREDRDAEPGSGVCIASSCAPLLVERMSRLEELYLFDRRADPNYLFRLPSLTRLGVLQVHGAYPVHDLRLLASNTAFRNLTHLLLHPHGGDHWTWGFSGAQAEGYRWEEGYLPLSVVRLLLHSANLPNLRHLRLRCSSMGDAGCAEIVRSCILHRLETLDLRHGCITDEGARLLASCPDLRRLKALDLGGNALTEQGVALLQAAGLSVRTDGQQTPEQLAQHRYLYQGEFE